MQAIARAYGWERARFRRINDTVWQVRCRQGEFALKRTYASKERLVFIASALLYLEQQQFPWFARLVRTAAGEPFLAEGNGFWLATRWIPGRGCDFRRRQDCLAAARTLAAMHLMARGLTPPPGSRPKTMYRLWPEKYEERIAELQAFQKLLAMKGRLNEFEKGYLKALPRGLELARQALELLHSPAYQQVAADCEQQQTFIHRDVADRNFIIHPEGRALLIDFDYCRQDLPVADVARLIQRSLKRQGWRPEVAAAILAAYEEVRPLSPDEKTVIAAFLTFPQKFWRLSNRYFYRKEGWSQGKYAGKLKKAVTYWERLPAICGLLRQE